MPVGDMVLNLARRSPAATAAALGAAVGAPTGAILSDAGEEGRGALQGALLGSGFGGGLGVLGRAVINRLPSAEQALIIGSLVGGGAGGITGQRRISPWLVEQIRNARGENKEASVGQEKTAEEKEAQDARIAAGDYGFMLRLKEAGLTDADLVKRPELAETVKTAEELPGATIAWAADRLEK